MAHHQESRDVHAKAPCRLDMLLRHIGLGAMRRDAHRAHAKIIGALEIMDGADAGEQQGGEHAMLKHLGDRADPVPVGVRPELIVEARSLQAVRSEEHTAEIQTLMHSSYAVFSLTK